MNLLMRESEATYFTKRIITFLLFVGCIFACESDDPLPEKVPIIVDSDTSIEAPQGSNTGQPVFLSFNPNQEYLNPRMMEKDQRIYLEVDKIDFSTDITHVRASFDLPDGFTAYVNGVKQISGSSYVDFSKPVNYKIKKDSIESQWIVEVIPFNCRVLIDASHGGGGWWFPQYGIYDSNDWHQGTPVVEELKALGLEIKELGRDVKLDASIFEGYNIVFRTGGFRTYEQDEVDTYLQVLEKGINLALFTDHKKNDSTDEIAENLDLIFEGVVEGTVGKFQDHPLTKDMSPFTYGVGSVLTNANENKEVTILASIIDGDYEGMPVMGILNHPNSKITFFGDINAFQFQTQPYFRNLITWIGMCEVD